MSFYIEKSKQFADNVFNNIDKSIVAKYSGQGTPSIETFVRHYYAHVSEADMLRMDLKCAAVRALSAWEFFLKREDNKRKLDITSPDMKKFGWRTPRTLIQTLNDDQPFLLDSLNGELNEQGFEVYSVYHPIFLVKRDDSGNLLEVIPADGKAKGYKAESLIDFEATYCGTGQDIIRLQKDINSVLDAVNSCVRDFNAMCKAVDGAIDSLSEQPDSVRIDHLAETIDFLKWLRANHFIFLGYTEYDFTGEGNDISLAPVEGSSLGLFTLEEFSPATAAITTLPPELRQFLVQPELMDISKSVRKSRVHRHVQMDYISIKKYNKAGKVVGDRRILGLFTSSVYFDSITHIPMLRRKYEYVLEQSNLTPNGHDGKALATILEQLPRDEMFEMSSETLLEIAMGILSLESRPRVRAFIRKDSFERFVSALVFVPRKHFSTEMRSKIQSILEYSFHGKMDAFYTQMTDSPLARVHLKIRTTPGAIPDVNIDALNERLAHAVSAWEDSLYKAMLEKYGENHGQRMFRAYANAFDGVYTRRYSVDDALCDVEHIEESIRTGKISIELDHMDKGLLRLKMYSPDAHIMLSEVMPVLENIGCKVLGEVPSLIKPLGAENGVWLHDFELESPIQIDVTKIKPLLAELIVKIWDNEVENDGFNRLVLAAGLPWRAIVVLRAYARYMKQTRFGYSQEAIQDAFARYSKIARLMFKWFEARFDPELKGNRADYEAKLQADIETEIAEVSGATEDRILRRYVEMIKATNRTNYYQLNEKNELKPCLSLKFNPMLISNMPLPCPFAEIFVYARRVEGVHLRGGKVARGGLRWSDRHEDFRTEILGLVKAQMVKNAVIVPEGSKGGFIVKCPPASGDRQEMMEEGIYCYMTYLSGLLDVTDNIVDGKIVPPQSVVRHDDDDPYLVVAADKGTATFSDIANSVSENYGFWLGDAFASGGSAGYDHKKMGITAKGAWVSVRRHFSEMGLETQADDFTVVGIGDMSGDVFGNGMLLSEHIKLLGAFNHLHIFVDPDPDAKKSFAERKRMFALPRSSWADYNSELISKGGGIFERSAKKIKISPQMKVCFDIAEDNLTPDELIRAMLKAPVDLLWNGGIGTYVKASDESHEQVGDRTNNSLRVNGEELRCKVVGEGGNLGFTQKGRIEYALKGGRVNTDAIDNSGGVDCSDHEVNIKIALGSAVQSGKLSLEDRDKLLAEMTGEVERLVLRDNYLQTQALTTAQVQGIKLIDQQARLIRTLEKSGLLNRQLESLPDEEELARRKSERLGLARPELSVILAYSKLDLYRELLSSALPDDEYFVSDLMRYFPVQMQERHKDIILSHQLRREIVATTVTNSIINRMGSTFFFQVKEDTGLPSCDIARAYVSTRDSFGLRAIWADIEKTPALVPVETCVDMVAAIHRLIYRSTLWFLHNMPQPINISAAIKMFRDEIAKLLDKLPDYLSGDMLEAVVAKKLSFVSRNIPEPLAEKIAMLPFMAGCYDIITAARQSGVATHEAAEIYFAITDNLKLDKLRRIVENISTDAHWARLAVSAIVGDLFREQHRLTLDVATNAKGKVAASLDIWFGKHSADIQRFTSFVDDISTSGQADVSMLVVALRKLQSIAKGDGFRAPEPASKAA